MTMSHATFRQLQVFVAVAQSGRISAAANTLLISQQAVSNQIRALERRLGHSVFDRRKGAAVVLNSRGQALFERAPELLGQAEDMQSQVAAASAAPVRVRVAAGEHIRFQILIPALPPFQLEHPEIQVEFCHFPNRPEAGTSLGTSPSAVTAAILSGKADLAYYAFTPEEMTPLAEVIGTAEAGLFAAPDHPITQRLPLEPGQALPMIMPLSGSMFDTMVVSCLTNAGFRNWTVLNRAQTAQTIGQLAMQGAGVCLQFKEFAAPEVRAGRLVDLGVRLQTLYRCAVRRPGALDVPELKAFDTFAVETLRRAFQEQASI
jgi:DNA-binding transcriptional LysR family regulator